MTRLPWHHSRSRTKSNNEKLTTGGHEWFSRNTSEPSRQALSELVRVHKREKSDESEPSLPRSRGTTITSVDWEKDHKRTGSTSDEAWSRPTSAHHVSGDSTHSTSEKAEGTTKALFAKGSSMLRRTGSKMSLSSAGSASTMGFTSPPRLQSSHGSSGTTLLREDIRSKISAPFDFQHITHTEQTQFPGLSRIRELELAQQFKTVTTRQSAANGLKGIEVSDLPSPRGSHHGSSAAQSPTSSSTELPQLPSTPPRPAPPPKDDAVQATVGENLSPGMGRPLTFSRSQSPKLTHNIGQGHTESLDVRAPSRSFPSGVDGLILDHDLGTKPLPHLPVIHAVTTEDDTARAMISAPLPTPPVAGSNVGEGDYFTARQPHHRHKSSVAIPRHMSFYPSAKTSMPNLLHANHLSSATKSLPRHRSDLALSQQMRNGATASSTRSSMTFAAIDTMNWEDAVDEAWDVFDEPKITTVDMNISFSPETYLETGRPFSDLPAAESRASSTSSPAMHTPGRPRPASVAEKPSPPSGMEVHQLESVNEDDAPNNLTGLGISACPPSGATQATGHFSRSSSLHFSKRRSSQGHLVVDTLTRSSSQESIIMSIASSIVGTQRSSNSSVLVDDLMSMNTTRDSMKSVTLGYSQDSLTEGLVSTRPESGCLPSNVLEQISKAGFVAHLDTVPVETELPPVPPLPVLAHSKSTSKVIVPDRRSSVASPDTSRPTRRRSNTTGARSRQSARISYSLFPSAAATACPPTLT